MMLVRQGPAKLGMKIQLFNFIFEIYIVADILAILEEVPFGKQKLEIGLLLRQALFLNGILYNSEAWSDFSEKDVSDFEKIDEYLLRSIFKGQAKTPLEFLHLETGTLPIKYIIAMRRIMYHRDIVSRNDTELVKKIYMAQKENPMKYEWIKLLEKDFELIGETADDSKIERI